MAAWLATFYRSGQADDAVTTSTLGDQVAADVAALCRRGGDGSFSTWQFDRGAKLQGGKFDKGADFAASFLGGVLFVEI